MKYLSFKRGKQFLLVALLLFSVFVYSQSGVPSGGYYQSVPNPYHPANQNRQTNQSNSFAGWIGATIQYTSNTGHKATYTLNVAIQDNRVVAIDFGNGGSVHAGQNNSGYIYQGGELYMSQDMYGNVTSMYTTVRITYQDGRWQVFDITI